jgi:hypothetical protein
VQIIHFIEKRRNVEESQLLKHNNCLVYFDSFNVRENDMKQLVRIINLNQPTSFVPSSSYQGMGIVTTSLHI